MASTTVLKANKSFSFRRPDGSPGYIGAGKTYHKDSPLLEGLGSDTLDANFDPFEPDFGPSKIERPVERATARPSEKRSEVGRPKKAEPEPKPETSPEPKAEPEKGSTRA